MFLPTCMYIYYVHVWNLKKPEKGIRRPGTGAVGDYELYLGTGKRTQVLCERSMHGLDL